MTYKHILERLLNCLEHVLSDFAAYDSKYDRTDDTTNFLIEVVADGHPKSYACSPANH